jgi:hypothetical protein
MTGLESLQSTVQAALLQDLPLAAGYLSTANVAQFDVYRVAYRARLRAALRDNFDTLPLVMGDEAFDELANAYIASEPSRHYSLRWFGHRLGDFMATNDAFVPHPAMTDLARMEWALRNAFDAAPATPLTSAELAAVPATDWVELTFVLHPSVHLLSMGWAVGPVWHALKAGHDDMDPPEAFEHDLMVWRLGMNTQWKSLTPMEAAFLKGLASGRTFGQLCEALVGQEQAAATAVALLSDLIRAEAICAPQSPQAANYN